MNEAPCLSCRKLKSHYGVNYKDVWQHEYEDAVAELLDLTSEECQIWIGPIEIADEYKEITIRNLSFRTEKHEEKLKTQDSGVAATFTNNKGTASSCKFGHLQNVFSLNFGGKQIAMLRVNFYRDSNANRKIAGTHWVRNSGANVYAPLVNSFIAAEKVDTQVFFADDPEHPDKQSVFQYRGSSYLVPEHHLDCEGRLLNL